MSDHRGSTVWENDKQQTDNDNPNIQATLTEVPLKSSCGDGMHRLSQRNESTMTFLQPRSARNDMLALEKTD